MKSSGENKRRRGKKWLAAHFFCFLVRVVVVFFSFGSFRGPRISIPATARRRPRFNEILLFRVGESSALDDDDDDNNNNTLLIVQQLD